MDQKPGENPIQQEIVDKLRHEHENISPNSTDVLNINDHPMLGSRFSADHRRLLAEAAALQAAALQCRYTNHLPIPLLGNREYKDSRDVALAVSQRSHLGGFTTGSHSNDHGSSFSSGGSSQSTPSTGGLEEMELTKEGSTPSTHDPSQWTYEEQFKQLYDMGNEPDRKQFLDDLFVFMQKKGAPVNRIPIMAKQTLDIYLLFKLVVAKGGLVEVINKKLWREITKGLCLPNSITSAAFTLRTQYMKFLYPYECEKYGFSTPAELHSAIDGNRREGRRPGFPYDTNPGGLPLPLFNPQSLSSAPFFNPSLLSNPMMSVLTAPQLVGTSMMSHGNNLHQLAANGLQNGANTLKNNMYDGFGSSARPQSLSAAVGFPSTKLLPGDISLPLLPERRDLKRARESEALLVGSDQIKRADTKHPTPSRSAQNTERRESGDKGETVSTRPPSAKECTNVKTEANSDKDDDSVRVTMRFKGNTYQGLLFPRAEEKEQVEK